MVARGNGARVRARGKEQRGEKSRDHSEPVESARRARGGSGVAGFVIERRRGFEEEDDAGAGAGAPQLVRLGVVDVGDRSGAPRHDGEAGCRRSPWRCEKNGDDIVSRRGRKRGEAVESKRSG